MKIHRHHLQLDETTQLALDQIAKATLQTKSSIMRRYIQQGIGRDFYGLVE
jgi:predicted transcriptional regulator